MKVFILLLVLSAFEVWAANPVEVGKVKWGRDLAKAYKASQSTGKPVYVLFQEVPGCLGCRKFGREVMSHPLMVEAVEDLFIPVLVYNNRKNGFDEKLLKKFNEPAWNYQVVRFLNADGKDIIARKDKVWTLESLSKRMIEVLEKSNRPVPKYLKTLSYVGDSGRIAKCAFAMHCFWTGEVALGKSEGVVSTEAGWIDGREVTLVHFDKKRTNLKTLVNVAKDSRCADKIYAEKALLNEAVGERVAAMQNKYRPARPSDQKKQIEASRWLSLEGLTPMQKTKINAHARTNPKKAFVWLSPRQQRVLQQGK